MSDTASHRPPCRCLHCRQRWRVMVREVVGSISLQAFLERPQPFSDTSGWAVERAEGNEGQPVVRIVNRARYSDNLRPRRP